MPFGGGTGVVTVVSRPRSLGGVPRGRPTSGTPRTPSARGGPRLHQRPIDYLGVNYYTGEAIGAGGPRGRQVAQPEAARTDMGWEVHPDGLREVLLRVSCEYSPKAIYITENGAAFPDVIDHDGKVDDLERRQYLQDHVRAAAEALQTGVPLRGYF